MVGKNPERGEKETYGGDNSKHVVCVPAMLPLNRVPPALEQSQSTLEVVHVDDTPKALRRLVGESPV
jgi:hypothetical protein